VGSLGEIRAAAGSQLPIPIPGAIYRPLCRKLTGAEFGHTQSRNFVYPGFSIWCCAVSEIFGDRNRTHLLGVAAGGVLLLTWRRLVPLSRTR